LNPEPVASSTAEGYASDLAWLDCLLEREVLRLRARYELSLDELRGLYISDLQVDELLRRRMSHDGPTGPAARLTESARELRALRAGDTPLTRLARSLALTDFESALLVLALAPELDLKYETIYAYLNNDVTRKHATADLAMRVFREAGVGSTRESLGPCARLFTMGILEWFEPHGDRRPQLAHGMALSPSAVRHLLGDRPEDGRIPAGIRWEGIQGLATEQDNLSESARSTVRAFARAHPVEPGLTVCRSEAVREGMAAARIYAGAWTRPTLLLPPSALSGSEWDSNRSRIHALALLSSAAVMLADESGDFPREPGLLQQLSRQIHDLLSTGLPVIWCVPDDAPWGQVVVDQPYLELLLPAATSQERASAWRTALAQGGLPVEAATAELSERFQLPCSRVRAAAQSAIRRYRGAEAEDGVASLLWRVARQHSNQALGQLAGHVRKSCAWEDLVLPEATLEAVREFASAIAQRDRVYRMWRMAERVGHGRGIIALFSGSSGTGKTLTASVIANSLELDLYRIDLSAVVSKYIGETEKNLDRVFRAARHSNAIILLDEGEVLLSQRTRVTDAHDKYANLEVAYLLQKMEEHEGIMILASNLPKNIDPAFARRMQYVVEFPRPNVALRERLWRGMFPTTAPLHSEVDFRFLAEQFDTSGGEIQTIALDAAFLASADGGVITMECLVKAMARHQLRQGSPAAISQFKQYHALARP
jgi:hypothetical protein